MATFSILKKSLLAACLVSVGLAGCSKEKKDAPSKTTSAEATSGDKDAPKDAPGTAPKTAASGALAYLPAGCAVAMHADLTSISANSVIKTHLLPALHETMDKGLKSSEEFKGFLETTGLDPFTHLHEVSGCLGEIPLDGGDPMGILTVTGDINGKIFDELVKSSGELDKKKVIELKGQKLIDDDGAVFTQMADGSLSGGNHKDLLVASIDKPNAFAADFKALGKSDMSIVIPAKTVTMGLGMPGSPFTQFAEKIDGATTVAVDVGKRTLTIKIGTVDEASANELAGMAKLLLGQVPKGGEGIEAGLMAALAASKTAGEGKQFVMTIELPADQFELGCKMIAGAIRSEL